MRSHLHEVADAAVADVEFANLLAVLVARLAVAAERLPDDG
jgi:hypothetical protein